MKKIILFVMLAISGCRTSTTLDLSREELPTRIIDPKFGIEFPESIGGFVFDSLSILEDCDYSIGYSATGNRLSNDLYIEILPNEQIPPVYHGKAYVRYKKPIPLLSEEEIVTPLLRGLKGQDKTIHSDWTDYEGIRYSTYSYQGGDDPFDPDDLFGGPNPALVFCLSIHRYDQVTFIVRREFSDTSDFINNHKAHLDEMRRFFSSQELDPSVKTFVESSNAQGVTEMTPRIIDPKFGIRFPASLEGFVFDHLVIVDDSAYEIDYSVKSQRSFDLGIRIHLNDPVAPVYLSEDEIVAPSRFAWKGPNWTIYSDWTDYKGVSYCTYSHRNHPVTAVCLSIHRYEQMTFVVRRKFSDKPDLNAGYKAHLDEMRRFFSNQQVDPIVTTPVDEVEAQSTQGHP